MKSSKFKVIAIVMWLCTILLFFSCQTNVKRAHGLVVEKSDSNPELSKLLDIARQVDSLRDCILYILANIENKSFQYDGIYHNDYAHINADSVVYSIQSSLVCWNTNKCSGQYDREIFLKYIMPYRVACEPLEYYWKKDCYDRFKPYYNQESILESAKAINSQIVFKVLTSEYGNPIQGYSSAKFRQEGHCGDRAILAAMALRSVGIPAAVDLIPYRGNVNNGHSMVTVILPTGENVAFHGPDEEGNVFQVNKTPKVFRYMYDVQRNSIIYKERDREYIPLVFRNSDLLDVTQNHAIHSRDLLVDIPVECKNRIVYLSVFSPKGWQPVDYAPNKKSKTQFSCVGTGAEKNGKYVAVCEGMGEGILYQPVIYDKSGEEIPIGAPIIHSVTEDRLIRPDTNNLQTVVLTRKYPRMRRIVDFAKTMNDGFFEGSMFRDFRKSDVLKFVINTPSSHYQSFEVDGKKKYKYIRFRKSSGIFNLGELRAYDVDGNLLVGKAMADPLIQEYFSIDNIADNDPLTFLHMTGFPDMWAGIELEKPAEIAKIEYCPRTDDNDICPGDVYELFYWDQEWISLGEKEAEDYSLSYDNVPSGALLWLRNLTKGIEERPFTYENGCQIWW